MVQIGEVVRICPEQRTASDHFYAERAATVRDLPGRVLLGDHGADEDVIRPENVLVFNRSHIDVDQLFCQDSGSIAATVKAPRGGKAAFLRTTLSACLKLQNVSETCGYTRRIFIGDPLSGR